MDCIYKNYKNNLSPEERLVLKQLEENENIILKPSDKGGGRVIMDRDHYIDEIVKKRTFKFSHI